MWLLYHRVVFGEFVGEGAGAEDLELFVLDFDEGGRWVVDGVSVFDVGDMPAKLGRKLVGMRDIWLAGEVGAGGDKRAPENADDFEKFRLVRDANADERAAAGDCVGDFCVFREEDGEWAGKISFNNSLFERGESFRVGAKHAKVAHEEQERFLGVAVLGDFDLLDGAFVQSVGKNTINRVGRRDDEVALAEFVDNAGEVHEGIIA